MRETTTIQVGELAEAGKHLTLLEAPQVARPWWKVWG